MRKKMLTTVLLGLALLSAPATARAEEAQDVVLGATSGVETCVATDATGDTGVGVPEPTPDQPAAAPAEPPAAPAETYEVPAGEVVAAPAELPAAPSSVDTTPGEGFAGDSTDESPSADATQTLGASTGGEGEGNTETVSVDGAGTGTCQDQSEASGVEKTDSDAKADASDGTEGGEMLGAPAPSDEMQTTPVLSDNAVYAISSESAPTLAVAAKAGGNVELTKKNTLLGEYWRAVDCGDGAYLLVSMDGNRALAVSGAIKNGTNVIVSDTGTRWALIKNADGKTYTVVPMGYDGFCLDVYGAGTTVGANLQVYKRDGSITQRFTFALQKALTEAVASACVLEGAYTIKPQANGSLSFDIASGSKSAGANARLWTANGSFAQTYDITPLGNGLCIIRAAHSGKVLEVQGGSTQAGANVRQYNRNNTLAQLWYLMADGAGYRICNAKSGLAIDLANGSATKSANLKLGGTATSASQVFSLNRTCILAHNSVYMLNPQNAASLHMAVAGNSASMTAAVKTAANASVLGQYWRANVQEDGSVILINLRSGAALGATSLAKGVALAVSPTGVPLKVQLNDDGTLTLRPMLNQGLVLDVKGGSTSSGAALQLWSSNGSKAQRFVPVLNSRLTAACKSGTPVNSGVYRIGVASAPSYVIDIESGIMAAGANVQLYASNGSMAQKYVFTSLGNGLYSIRAANSGKMLSVAGASTASGANVIQANQGTGLEQCWYLVGNGSGGYSIRNAKSGLALDVYKGKIAKKSNIQIHTYNGTAAEQFVLTSVQLVKDGTYSFASALTTGSLVFEVAGGKTTSGANVAGYQSNGTDAQKWVLVHVGDGQYTLKNLKSGLYLDVAGQSNDKGANVVQCTMSDSASQRWIIGVTNDGALTFMNAKSGKYLDVSGGKAANGVNIQQWNGNGTASQGWNIKEVYDALPSGKLGKFVSRMVYYCDIASVGYDQSNRWDIRDGGECDCSSLVITCLYETGFITSKEYQKTIFYTGNMSEVLTKMGWSRINKVDLGKVKPGDILLNDEYHVCVVVSGSGKNAMIAQASIDERGRARGGQAGDQTGNETHIKKVYNYSGGWDCILRYTA